MPIARRSPIAGFTDAEAELRLQSFLGRKRELRPGLDFLLSLPEVDPSASASPGPRGGTQTFILGAIFANGQSCSV